MQPDDGCMTFSARILWCSQHSMDRKTFYTSSGFLVQDVLDLIFQRSGFEDVEMRVNYQCLSVLEDDLEHKGSFKFGRRKKGFLGFISPKDPNGQTHL